MPGFSETMRLKEKAEEDIYFARRDRELVEALRRRRAEERRAHTAWPERRPGGTDPR